jgi:hypothetical protein
VLCLVDLRGLDRGRVQLTEANMPRNTHKPAETPDTEHATETPAATEQATETPAAKPTLRDWVGLIGRVLADWIGFSVRRPRKGLPAVALGFGLGLLACVGLLLLYPPLNLNVYLWAGIVLPVGGVCIAWALWPQDDGRDE